MRLIRTNDARLVREIILACDYAYRFSVGLRWNRPMAFLSSGLSIVELTVFLCAIILALIPLTIRVLCDLESRKRDGWSRPGQKSIRAKIN
jgi:hypothetical protein